jgi:hypothetical protein
MHLRRFWNLSKRIGKGVHARLLLNPRRDDMRKTVWEKYNQLRLELEPNQCQIRKIQAPDGAVGALADLLLSAIGPDTLLASGGNDDRQDRT